MIADLQLERDLITHAIERLEAFAGSRSPTGAPPRRRGRPPGSKNKPPVSESGSVDKPEPTS
jgi:hypothetical protein